VAIYWVAHAVIMEQHERFRNLTRGSSISKTAKPRDVRTDGTADPRSVPFLTISGNGGARRKSPLGLQQESNGSFESSAWYPNSGSTTTTEAEAL
jgi:hypothetical protein